MYMLIGFASLAIVAKVSLYRHDQNFKVVNHVILFLPVYYGKLRINMLS